MHAGTPTRTPPGTSAPPQGTRHPRRIDYALKRLKENWLLRGSAVLAFMDYGGAIALVLARKLPLEFAGVIIFMSLASWVFLLAWFPILEETMLGSAGRQGRAWLGRALEAFAIASVVIVHALMAIMIVFRARS